MPWYVLVIILGGVGLLVLILIGLYNRLVKARNRVDEAESDITVQYKRRYDLIPQLVKTVKGYAKHEKETLAQVVKARNQAMGAQGSGEATGAENMLAGALKNLFALAESYPDLKANQNFLQLQEELTDTENKIQAARRLYNSTLRSYIDATQVFPQNVVAGLFGFKVKHDYFEVEQSEQEAVTKPVDVDF